jgi:hypothetical protein
MNKTPLHWLRNMVVAVSATVLLTACTEEAPLGPTAFKAPLAALPAAALSTKGVDLGACQDLRVSAGSELVFHAYAKGVQIYHWNGSIWAFDGPSAVLFADAEGKSTVGTHSAGPIWESMSGGKVAGAILKKCFVDANSIPWLLLSATPIEGAGVFQQATLIQRVNTVGGNAPSYNGTLGEEARVPYTTEYLFYRAP